MKKNEFETMSMICLPTLVRFSTLVLILMMAGCPLLTTLETPDIGSKPDYPDPFAVGNSYQVDLGLTALKEPDTIGNFEPIRVRSGVPLIEGKIKWILVDERLEFTLNGGTSGLGVAVKGLILKNPLDLGLKFGLTGLPYIIRSFPTGCYTVDLLAGKQLNAEKYIFGGCKFVSWVDIPQPTPVVVDPYFDAVGGFLGLKIKGIKAEVGIFRIFNQFGNYWGRNNYIPVLGVSVPFND